MLGVSGVSGSQFGGDDRVALVDELVLGIEATLAESETWSPS